MPEVALNPDAGPATVSPADPADGFPTDGGAVAPATGSATTRCRTGATADGEPLRVHEHTDQHPAIDQPLGRHHTIDQPLGRPLREERLPPQSTVPAVPPQGTGQNVTPGAGNGSAGARPPG
ncbi:hypothetical protein [Nonomuraea fuscirosea]|uniref:hypothetical protein n=1 Tax=Nonomuraea fuscirosea TaxID=1291556 RepID=UPI003448ACC6